MWEIEIEPIPLDRLYDLLSPQRADKFDAVAKAASAALTGTTVWNVNATGKGGGVAEMLQTMLAYGRGAGVDTRWLVLDGDRTFFTITKRVHNMLHGSPGDGGPLGRAERDHFAKVLTYNLRMAEQAVRAGDIVILHDPQTAGLVDGLRRAGAHVVWRCHVGFDGSNDFSDTAWEFLRHHIAGADAFVFSRQAYVPSWVPAERTQIIAPSIDPFSAKNKRLTAVETTSALGRAGLLEVRVDAAQLGFTRRDGSTGRVRAHRQLVRGSGPIPGDARLVVQVSRWDRLKDMPGVLRGFVDNLDRLPDDVHLALVGPDVSGVSDDPEGAEVLRDCFSMWTRLNEGARHRVHLICLPMDDVDENAHLVNALQHHAAVVVQKSLVEGFGLTVTEAMWKARPMVASAVGGIQDQIEDGVHGLLLHDPLDLDGFAAALEQLLADPAYADRLGEAARDRVVQEFLGDRHLTQYAYLFQELLAEGSPAPAR